METQPKAALGAVSRAASSVPSRHASGAGAATLATVPFCLTQLL